MEISLLKLSPFDEGAINLYYYLKYQNFSSLCPNKLNKLDL